MVSGYSSASVCVCRGRGAGGRWAILCIVGRLAAPSAFTNYMAATLGPFLRLMGREAWDVAHNNVPRGQNLWSSLLLRLGPSRSVPWVREQVCVPLSQLGRSVPVLGGEKGPKDWRVGHQQCLQLSRCNPDFFKKKVSLPQIVQKMEQEYPFSKIVLSI